MDFCLVRGAFGVSINFWRGRRPVTGLYQLSGIEDFSVHSVFALCSGVPFVVEQSSAVFGFASFASLYLFARDADDTVFIDPS